MSEAKRFKFGKRNVSLFCHIHAAEPAAESIVETNFDRIDIPLEGQSAAGADHAGARPAVQSESCTPTYPLADCPPHTARHFHQHEEWRPPREKTRASAGPTAEDILREAVRFPSARPRHEKHQLASRQHLGHEMPAISTFSLRELLVFLDQRFDAASRRMR
jgi:hypothetical protein